MKTDEAPELIAEAIRELGYRATVEGDQVLSSVSGMRTVVVWDEADTVQFTTGVRGVPDRFGLEQVNRYNRLYRFGSVYLEAPGTLVLQADFLLDLRGEGTGELEKMLSLFEACIGQLRQMLYDSTDDYDDDDGERDSDGDGQVVIGKLISSDD